MTTILSLKVKELRKCGSTMTVKPKKEDWRKRYPNYVIKPAAGSLLSDDFVSQQDPVKLDKTLKRMLERSGVKHKKDKKNV